jgi:hypothetical protein
MSSDYRREQLLFQIRRLRENLGSLQVLEAETEVAKLESMLARVNKMLRTFPKTEVKRQRSRDYLDDLSEVIGGRREQYVVR